MLVWVGMLLSIFLLRFFIPDGLGEKKKQLLFLGLSFGIIVFVVGSRSPILTDSVDLYRYSIGCFSNCGTMTVEELHDKYGWEYGYLILNKILYWICPWEQFIIYFEAAFCTGVMFWFTYKNTENVLLSILSYICIGPWQFFLTGFKQGIAICICFIAFEQIKKKHTSSDIIGLALIVLAASIHVTAWVALAAFLIRYFKMNKITILIVAVATIITFSFAYNILSFAGNLTGEEYQDKYVGNPYAGIVPIIIYVFTLISSYVVWRKDKSYLEKYSFEIAMLFFGLCLYTFRYNVSIFERVSFYFTPIVNIVLPNSIKKMNNRTAGNVWLVLWITACLALFVYRVEGLGEYHFFWEA